MVDNKTLKEEMQQYFNEVKKCVESLLTSLMGEDVPKVYIVSVDNDHDGLFHGKGHFIEKSLNRYFVEFKIDSVQNFYSGTSMNYIDKKAGTLFKSLYTVDVTAKIWGDNFGASCFDCVEMANFLYQSIKTINDRRALSGKNYQLTFKESSKMVVDFFLSERGTKIQMAVVPLTFSFFREFIIKNNFTLIKEIKENKIKAYEEKHDKNRH